MQDKPLLQGETVFKFNRKKAMLLAAALVVATLAATGSAYAVVQKVAAAPAPSTSGPGVYRGTMNWCVKSTDVRPDTKASDAACPTGFVKVVQSMTGAKGDTGPAGVKGDKGETGAAAPAPVYGTGRVYVKRGSGTPSVWASVSTSVGSPDGDNASNTFRMTCSAANAPCVISLKAASTVAGVTLYPRLHITKSNIDTGAPMGLCEYGDGVDNDGASATLTTSYETVNLGIGGSLDCGSTQVRPASGVVDSIEVPAGYYDIAATMVFKK